MAESTIGALANLETATATDHGVVATLTEANSCLATQLEDLSNKLKDIKALLKKKEQKEGGRELSTLPQKISVGFMVTSWPISTKSSAAIIPSIVTSVNHPATSRTS
jgi:hypothetical protein